MDDRLVRPKSENLAERALRSLLERLSAIGYGTPIYSARLKGRFPLKLLANPDDPWKGEVSVGIAIQENTFIHASHHLTAQPTDLWEKATDAPATFTRWLQGYRWLRDLSAIRDQGSKKAARETGKLAEDIIKAWLTRYSGWHATAWRPDILGERLMMWIMHAPLILSSSDMDYRSAVLNSLIRQSRHLARSIGFAAAGPGRVTAAVGLIMSGLLVAGGERRAKRGFVVLRRALEQQILPDGGPLSRNPADAVRMARDLVILKNSCAVISATLPEYIQTALGRLIPFIRALSHKDHGMAHFNGAFASDCADVDDLTGRSGVQGIHARAITSAPGSGYQRLKRWRTLVLLDTGPAVAGPPPPKTLGAAHHAGVGAMEFSDGKDRIIVNMGGSDAGYGGDPDGLLELSRTSAAHSTLVIDDENSARPGQVAVDRNESDDGQWLEVSHDGYARRGGVILSRRLFLDASGDDLRGEDVISARPRRAKQVLPGRWLGRLGSGQAKTAAIHFHLHPRISASLTQDLGTIILRLPHGHGWLFRCKGAVPTLEDSIYLEAPDQPVKTQQIVLRTDVVEDSTVINWSFRRLDSHN